jgi:hypothetical protein
VGSPPRQRTCNPGQPWVAHGRLANQHANQQSSGAVPPAGCRPPVTHHLNLGNMVPTAMGYSPSLPEQSFHRGWEHIPLQLDVRAEPSRRGRDGYSPAPSGRSIAATCGHDSQRSMPSERSYRHLVTPPASQRQQANDHQQLYHAPHHATDAFLSQVGGVLPGYTGHVPRAADHCGASHIGAAPADPAQGMRRPMPHAQHGHGEHVTRMDKRHAHEVAGPAATHVGHSSVPGYRGHCPGAETGAFGVSTWRQSVTRGGAAPPSPATQARPRTATGASSSWRAWGADAERPPAGAAAVNGRSAINAVGGRYASPHRHDSTR